LKDITIFLIDRNGKKHSLRAPTDINMNLMELCKSYDFPVQGICGGMAMCASCQIYIHSNHNLNYKTDDEEAMLSEAFNWKENSRLGCQIQIKPDLDGLIFEIAPE
jgi:2Fe-2S ferredoxin|tara:strand:+ start:74 stop:391 length:318 start_codon:yes stop_codon:yes gene_type:complete